MQLCGMFRQNCLNTVRTPLHREENYRVNSEIRLPVSTDGLRVFFCLQSPSGAALCARVFLCMSTHVFFLCYSLQFAFLWRGMQFAGGKFTFCRLSGKKFAVGQRDTCNRQTFTLPTANQKFAVGKCAAGHRQNSCLINGKIKFCHRQIFIF